MPHIFGSTPSDVVFGSHTQRRRDKRPFRQREDLSQLDNNTLLKKLDFYSQPRSFGNLPRHLRFEWGNKLDVLITRLVEVIRDLPSASAARRLEAKLKNLKHFTMTHAPRIKRELETAMMIKPETHPHAAIESADDLLDTLGVDQPAPGPSQKILDRFHWGRPIVTSESEY